MKSPHSSHTRPANARRPIPALALIALAGVLMAPAAIHAGDLPRKAQPGTYAGLWNNSPFTSRPVVQAPDPIPEDNPLDDYALTGVSPISDGFRVTLINRNDPTERIVVDSTRPSSQHDFEIINVNRSPGRPLSTTVELTDGNFTATVAFEQELLTLRPPPAAAPPTPPQQAQPGNPQQNQGEETPRRQPRPRVVPPPVNAQQQAQGQQGARGQRGPTTQGSRERTDRRSRR